LVDWSLQDSRIEPGRVEPTKDVGLFSATEVTTLTGPENAEKTRSPLSVRQ